MTVVQKPFRNVGAILGFLLKGEVDAIFKQHPFELSDKHADPASSWRASFDAVRRLPGTPTNVQIGFLDEAQFPVIKEVRSRKTFAKYYDAIDDHQFAMVPINSLLAPQWHADLDYIDELALQISESSTLEDLIRFTMAEGSITEPIITNGQVIFTSLRPDIYADQIPTVREIEPGEFEIVVRANSRPNYVSVASIGGRLLLTNGVHHVCALHLRGFDSTPCVLRSVSRLEDTGLNLQSTMFRPELMSGPRPAQVLDFLTSKVAVPLKMRSMYHILRIAVGVEPMRIPAISDGILASRPRESEPVPGPAGLTSEEARRPAAAS
jgi:hypothetical protein